MGRRGPQPVPSIILKARGSWRGRREGEPQPEPSAPDAPAWLSDAGRAEWDQVVAQLRAMNLLRACDRNAIARYAFLCARYMQVAQYVAQHGETGSNRMRPEARVLLEIGQQLLRLEQHFGLTPAARASLGVRRSNPKENRGKGRFFKIA